MPERISKRDVVGAFTTFLKAYKLKPAESYKDVGGHMLDYAYGGYVIEKIASEGGGISQPFGAKRRKAKEMHDVLWFAIDVKRLGK